MSASASGPPPSPAMSLSLLSLLARSLTEIFMGLLGSLRALFQSITTSRGDGFAFEKLLDREDEALPGRSLEIQKGI